MNLSSDTLKAFDRQYIWHPFTPQWPQPEQILLERGQGVYLIDSEGRRYIDAIASWWVNPHGHAHPYLVAKVHEQATKLEHAIFAGFTHEPAISLAYRLIQITQKNYHKVFFSDNGSTAVEVALKMAFQYWFNKEQPRTKVVAFENAYHGDTFGAMSVAARNVFNQAFQPLLFDVISIPLPNEENINEVSHCLQSHLETASVAAFIFEPLVQGAGGMQIYEASHLEALLDICRQQGVITIADEVFTGFYRTGKPFAIDYLQHKPDIICLSKSLSGGMMPLGATLCKSFIYQAFVSSDKWKTFFHGHSFTANPLACAAANASFDLMETPSFQESVVQTSKLLAAFASVLRSRLPAANVRQLGNILAFDLPGEEATNYLNSWAPRATAWFLAQGIYLRPLGNVVYITPPYIISAETLNNVFNAILLFIEEHLTTAQT